MSVNIRDAHLGHIYATTPYLVRHETQQALADISREHSLVLGGRGQVEWNVVQIGRLQQVVKLNVEALERALDDARRRRTGS